MNDVIANADHSKNSLFVCRQPNTGTLTPPALNGDAADVVGGKDHHHPTTMKVSAGSGDSESVGDAASCNGIDEPPTSPVTDPDELALLEKLLQANRLVFICQVTVYYWRLVVDWRCLLKIK